MLEASEPDLSKLGAGAVDHGAAAEAIEGVGYHGWLSIEVSDRGGLDGVNTSLRLAKVAYRRLVAANRS